MNGKKIKILQIVFFCLFLFTFILPFLNESLAHFSFIKLDILVYIFSFKINFLLLIPVILIVLHLLFGRIFCSFLCPMGNLITFFDSSFKHLRKNKKKKNYKKLTLIPAGILLLILILKLFHINIIGFLDPIPVIHRFFTLTFVPLLGWIFRPENETPVFFIYTGYILLFIILLSFAGERIWCRFICPLGIIHRLTSILARYRRVVNKCTPCEKCTDICPTNAINIKDPLKYDRSLCILCYKCTDTCPENTVFKFINKKRAPSKSRRNFLKSVFSSFIFFNFTLKKKKEKLILRPPGATLKSIRDNCSRCMECARICPTSVIQPAGSDNGLADLFTPQIRMDMGYCAYNCNLCGKICPTDSIKNLALKKKQKWIIGTAEIDHKSCIVWRKGVPCRVCEKDCPIPEKAIKFKKFKWNNKILNTPVVDKDLCNGCGICQNKCPVKGSAIIVKKIIKKS